MTTARARDAGQLLCAALAAACVLPAAAWAKPSLRLFSGERAVRLTTVEARSAPDLGLWVGAVGGDFQIDLRRPGYRDWRVTQVDSTSGKTLREIPYELVKDLTGMREFIAVRIYDRGGRSAGRRIIDFCPGGFELDRVLDTGPPVPRFATDCGAFFPFARGLVWGLDEGWAVPALGPRDERGIPEEIPVEELEDLPREVQRKLRALGDRAPGFELKPGRYRAVARIRRPWRRLLGIPEQDGLAEVRLRVVRSPRPKRRRGRRPDQAAAAERAPRANASVPVVSRPARATLPDLVALPAWGAEVRSRRGKDVLRFSSTTWNAGPGLLAVEGYRRSRGRIMDAYQYFYDPAGRVTGKAPAGTMAFEKHGGHDHWHFLQFASYTLLDPSGRPVARGRKQSFCLAPVDAVDQTLPGAAFLTPDLVGLTASVCGSPGSIWLRQSLPVGWGDTYDASLAGQAFNITKVPNGRYYVKIDVNPQRQLKEATIANNVRLRRIRLGGRRGARRVKVARWRGIPD
jgi:hypothetical protein